MQTGDKALRQNLRRRSYADYLAVLFAPAPKRAALAAIGDFRCEVSRIGAQLKEPLLAEMRLHYWQESLKAAWASFSPAGQAEAAAEAANSAAGASAAAAPAQAGGGRFIAAAPADDAAKGAVDFSRGQSPLVKALANAGKAYDLPLKPLLDLCAAAAANTGRQQPPSRAEFEQYCLSVYSGRAELACRILADEIMAEAKLAADWQAACRHGGIAQGIAALAADLPQQLQWQILPVPAEILAGIGLAPPRLMALAAEEPGAAAGAPEIQRLAAALAAYFAEHYKAFKRAQRRLPAILRPAFLPLAAAPLFMRQAERAPNLLCRPNAADSAAGPSLMRQQGRIIAAALFNRF